MTQSLLAKLLPRLFTKAYQAGRQNALEQAAAHFERGNGRLLSQYEVARVLREMK